MSLPDKYITKIKDFFETHKVFIEVLNYNIALTEKAEQCNVSIMIPGDVLPIAHFELREMPGCCGIAISTNCWVENSWKGNGIGTFLHKLRINLAKEWGYGLLLCTDIDSNEVQKHILEKHNWKQIEQFANPRTGNIVNIHTLYL